MIKQYSYQNLNWIAQKSKKHKKVSRVLNCTEQLLILNSKVSGCVSVSAFASLVGIPVGIMSSVIGVKLRISLNYI